MLKSHSSDFRRNLRKTAFSDYIYAEKPKGRDHAFDQKGSSIRVLFLGFFLFIIAITLLSRILYLQIIKGSYYRQLSDNNRIKTVVIHAPRGIIFDRGGVPLVYNVPGFREIESTGGDGKTKLLSQEEAIPLLAKGKPLAVDALREYPFADALVHVLGYVGQISKEELKEAEFKKYLYSDIVGKMGIEKEYEATLKGIDGKKLIEVDSLGREIRVVGQDDPTSGKNITLTFDSSLQKKAFEAAEDIKKGAIIVSNPKGEILALVSKPSFDPNLFTLGSARKNLSDFAGRNASDSAKKNSFYKTVSQILLDSDSQPFLNRAISGTYPPGSTFKLVVAAAGLEDKIIDENYTVADTGILQVGAFSFSNWYFTQYGRTEGEVNVVKGIKRSNDIFFYRLAEKIGVEKISEMAQKFSVGSILGIDLGGEAKGILPSAEWKQKTVGEQWYLGDTYHYGIGQGYLLTTPLQVNIWTQAIANEGVIYVPHLLKNEKSPVRRSAPQGGKIKNEKFLSEKTVALIREGMVESCSPGGVAWPLFEFRIKNSELRIDGKNILEAPQATISADFKDYRRVTIACKTGTAQHGGEKTLPHAWITLFVPAYDPQIIITVLAEESGEGSNIAAPIAKKILEEWFGR